MPHIEVHVVQVRIQDPGEETNDKLDLVFLFLNFLYMQVNQPF